MRVPCRRSGIEHVLGPEDVRGEELRRVVDAAIDVGLGGGVDDGVGVRRPSDRRASRRTHLP